MNPYLSTILTFVLVLAFQGLLRLLSRVGLSEEGLSRKIALIGTGPIFVACWMLYPDGPLGPRLAALVPLAAAMYFALIGAGILRDDATVSALTRSGNRREMLRGPLIFALVFMALTLLYWKDSLIGIPALMMLCADGIADVVGRRLNSLRWPWSREKSIAGSLSMFLGGWLLILLVFAFYVWIGNFGPPFSRFIVPATWVAVGAVLVESMPLRGVDNLTVPLVCLLTGHFVF